VGIASRQYIWENLLANLSGFRILIGYGENTTMPLLKLQHLTPYTHNGLISILFTGGIIKLFIYVILLFDVFKKAVFVYKKNVTVGSILLATIVSTFLYSMGEDVVLLQSNGTSLIVTILAVSMTILFYNYFRVYGEIVNRPTEHRFRW